MFNLLRKVNNQVHVNCLFHSNLTPAFLSLAKFSDKKKIEIYYSPIQNIHFNLAIEEYLFTKSTFQHETLYLWRNAKTIVIGRHQNPWKECKVQQMTIDGVQLARRRTGGGAVFHDLGNTCFSFLSPVHKEPPLACKNRNNKIIVNTLQTLGVTDVEVQGRNDVTVQGKKVSGSAYQVKMGQNSRTLHHGTMMMNVNTNALENYLQVDKQKLVSKGIDSVKSRVMNLQELYKDINHDTLCKAMQDEFIKFYSPCEVEIVNLDDSLLQKNVEIQKIYSQLKSKEWIFFTTPNFTNSIFKRFLQKFDWGSIELNTVVEQGKITNGRIYSDCLYPDFIEKMNQIIQSKSVEYSFEGMKKFARIMRNEFNNDELFLKFIDDIEAWLIKSI